MIARTGKTKLRGTEPVAGALFDGLLLPLQAQEEPANIQCPGKSDQQAERNGAGHETAGAWEKQRIKTGYS
ncbi:MAG: hypothetical protein AAF732_06475, partial [Pseudomonadota bacterium]